MLFCLLHFSDTPGQCQKTVGTKREGSNIVSLLSQGQAYGMNPLPALSLGRSSLQREDLSFLKKGEETSPLRFQGFLLPWALWFSPWSKEEPQVVALVWKDKSRKWVILDLEKVQSGQGDRGCNYISVSFRWLWLGPKESFPWCLQISYVLL